MTEHNNTYGQPAQDSDDPAEAERGGILGQQQLPETGAPLPHAYGTSGDLTSDQPGATTGDPLAEGEGNPA